MIEVFGIVSDLDGTLSHSEPLHLEAWNQSIKPFKAQLSDEMYSRLVGKSTIVAATEIVKLFSLPIRPFELVQWQKNWVDNNTDKFPLQRMPFALEFLAEIWDTGLPLACATGSHAQAANQKLVKLCLFHYFQHIVTACMVERNKPFPDVYLKAAQLLNIPSDKLLAIEDTHDGLKSALSAGMRCIAVRNVYSKAHDFDGAIMVVDSLQEALTWIKNETVMTIFENS